MWKSIVIAIVVIWFLVVMTSGLKSYMTAFEDIPFGWIIWVVIGLVLYFARNINILK